MPSLMKLVVTIDTEEDNWGKFSPTGHTLRNIDRIPGLQEVFDACGVKPTYLITYPVATDPGSIALFRELERSGRCEIGTHCHPWNTPPFEEALSEENSMLCNLSPDLQYRKLRTLHDTIIRNFGLTPRSFRSGRWGYDESVAKNLSLLGYRVDTSITPYTDWKEYHGRDFSEYAPEPFRVTPGNGKTGGAPGHALVEIPATIAYAQKDFFRCNRVHKALSRKPVSRLRLIGILDRLNMLNKIWLSPEQSDGIEMIRLASGLIRKNYRVINMFFHSTTLVAGLTEYVRTPRDEKRFLGRIREFLTFINDAGIESIGLSDALDLVE